MCSKPKAFSDKWILIIGIPLIGIAFPFFFGSKFSDPNFFKWMFISIVTSLVTWMTIRHVVALIWRLFQWEKNPVLHIVFGLLIIILFSLFCSLLIYGLARLLFNWGPDYWQVMRPIRIGVFIVVAIIQLVHEAILLFFKWKQELTRSADLERENLRSKFEALKNHVNPHFLFNSLGTLTSLIHTDPGKAEKYVAEFAGIYRYLLEVNSNDLVTLGEEMAFIESYMFLQQIRFGEGFNYNNTVDKRYHSAFILPLTLELLVENALKHNKTHASSPLKIDVYVDEKRDLLIVRNTYQPRNNSETTGTGLKNLEQRYQSFLDKTIHHYSDDTYFYAEIPLISNEK
ncbi:MAG TPA: histidine kinase [Bacteroidales bacterium]|jgi:sensor histidine kinase YesM|nr:histidine kinase [Bacteroidales bacterium]